MADANHSDVATAEPIAAGGLVSGLKSFAAEHRGASAVIEYVGRKGARIVLIGEDGAWADEFAPATDVARDACVEAGVAVVNSWERDLTDRMHGSSRLWRNMGRRALAR